MGRKSALTPDQWIQVERRVLIQGEAVNAVAKSFGIDESAIRRKIYPNKSEGKEDANPLITLAKRKISAENEAADISEKIATLPFAKQEIVGDLAKKLRNISYHMGSAAELGAMTAHRLNAIAHTQTDRIDETATLDENQDALKSVMAMTRGANDAAAIGLNLLSANKEAARQLEPPPEIREIRLVPLLPKTQG